MNSNHLDMPYLILARPLAHFMPPRLQMQLPLDIPDYRRRPKIKPRPVRSAIYFGEEQAWPLTLRHAPSNGTQPAG